MLLNTLQLRPWQNGRRSADDTFKRIFLNENVRISIKISPKFVPEGPINEQYSSIGSDNGLPPTSEPMMPSLPTHICVIWPQSVNVDHWSQESSPLNILKRIPELWIIPASDIPIIKPILGHVTPLGWPRSVSKSIAECHQTKFPGILSRMAKWPWRSRSMIPISHTSWKNPKMHISCKCGDYSSNLL